jgi:hypothetical protein
MRENSFLDVQVIDETKICQNIHQIPQFTSF